MLPKSRAPARLEDMRPVFLIGLALAVVAAPAAVSTAQPAVAAHPRLTPRQARQMASLVARHDQIDLRDSHIEINSMDLGSEFFPGYFSFIVIRESSTPGPDETLRRYAVNRQTGDVWEMTLCTHYDFPQLTRMRRAFALPATAADLVAQSKQLGCAAAKPAPAS
ncbi:MAG TPA: effector immunity protein Tgi2PP [Acidobacteriaceae bacterium]|nr:effector immunity protein Tgi2PP [Acidobacteriaceae bacterium]